RVARLRLHGPSVSYRGRDLQPRPDRQPELPGRCLGVECVTDGPNDGDPRRARLDHGLDVRPVDAADREPRTTGMRGRVPDELEADRRATRLRRRRVHGPDADVVGVGRVDLFRYVRRLADADTEGPGLGHREVVLADVNVV